MPIALRVTRSDRSDRGAAPPAPWIPLAEAAARLGLSAGHLRRRCADDLLPRGLARQYAGAGWYLLPEADPRLRDVETWRDRDLRQLAAARAAGVRPRYIELAESRRDLLRAYAARESDLPGRTAAERIRVFLAAVAADGGESLSVSRFRQLRAAYEQPGESGGIAALIPAYRRGDACAARDPIGAAAWAHAERILLAGNRISAAVAYTLTLGHRRREGLDDDPSWRLPALRTFQLECRRRIPRPLRILADSGPRAFDAACIPKGQRDYEAIAAGECYIGDERILDIMVRVPDARRGWRPARACKLTAWLDERSRMVVGWVLAPFASSATILGALKRAIRDHGVPDRLRTDWGKDYRRATEGLHARRRDVDELDPQRIAGVIDRLGIRLQPATPYMPWAKSIESMFGAMKENFDALLAGYIGGSPTERHQDRHTWARQHVDLLPTAAEVEALLAQYLDGYHAAPHTGHGMYGLSPLEVMGRHRAGPARMLADDVLETMFLLYTDPRPVHRDGVRHMHSWYGWGDPRLVPMQGQRVILGLHPDDAGRAWVCDLDRRLLFQIESERHRFRTVRDAERIARTRSHLRREYAARVRPGDDWRIDRDPAETLADRAAGIAAQREAAGLPAAPPPADPPRLLVADPALSITLQSVAEPPLNARSDRRVELDDMLDIPRENLAPPTADADIIADDMLADLTPGLGDDMLDHEIDCDVPDDPPDDLEEWT